MEGKMEEELKGITEYFRSAVAAQSNTGLDFKKECFSIVSPNEMLEGKISQEMCESLFAEAKSNTNDDNTKSTNQSPIHIIICAKTIKTIYDSNIIVQNDIEELTGIYYIPADLDSNGQLLFNDTGKKLPWFPREYLTPMIEEKLAIGNANDVDDFMSNHVDQVVQIKSWHDYAIFFKKLYESVANSSFDENSLRNIDVSEPPFELEESVYLFLDQTINSTFHISTLYDHLLADKHRSKLYENFMSMKDSNHEVLINNDVNTMNEHCGQMNGEYPLSPSQREAINHFGAMKDGEILAVNGPPGTGKTTLLQSIVADMYVKSAIKKESPPLIVASSTNNQAVTNIIASFGNIKKMDISNLEERWIEGVNSFATYFPSSSKQNEARSKGYQHTNQRGQNFISDIETIGNIDKSQDKLLKYCNDYFDSNLKSIKACQEKLHNELFFIDQRKQILLNLADEASNYCLTGNSLDEILDKLVVEIKDKRVNVIKINERINEWESCYKKIPFYVKWLKFIKPFSKRIQTEFRCFLNNKELNFLNEYLSIYEIEDKYSQLIKQLNQEISTAETMVSKIENLLNQYDSEIELMEEHNISLPKGENKYKFNLNAVNDFIDKNHRYVEFWLAVHYYECRWVSGELTLTDNQKGTTYPNVIKKLYTRLSMLTPCLVMTFFMLPKQFSAYEGGKQLSLYNIIDLLIVDEAGQVSPEIAAGAFSLAKKAVVVGDVHQIEPVWSVNKSLDTALALSHKVIKSKEEFETLENNGLNTSCSSVMKVATKCCRYSKFAEVKGLFLSEHRRCYNEIISYSNSLVYAGHLEPMRGNGKDDKKLAIKALPQMGFKQIDSDNSSRIGTSRINLVEAEQIAIWLKANLEAISNAYPSETVENLVGIITPFKAQVKYIKAEIKKLLPKYYSQISVGTVHTFQGAERRIILLSTVYGKNDGCFFIDANNSLMNVAVSRAKDNFLVFGDLNCLSDSLMSASGQLKKCVKDNEIEDILL